MVEAGGGGGENFENLKSENPDEFFQGWGCNSKVAVISQPADKNGA